MEKFMGPVLVAGACGVILVIGALRSRAEWLLNLMLRALLGMIAVYFINEFLAGRGIAVAVGINGITFLTSAILGFPGLAALYGLGFYQLL